MKVKIFSESSRSHLQVEYRLFLAQHELQLQNAEENSKKAPLP